MYKSLIVFLLIVPFSCLSPQEIDFSADSEIVGLDQQLKQVFSDLQVAQVKKTVYIDGQEESSVFPFDTLVLQQDLKILKDYNFSRLIRATSYTKIKTENGWLFSRNEGEKKGPVELNIGKTDNQLSTLFLLFEEANMLYESKKTIQLTIENNKLANYQIKGERKLLGLSPTRFSLDASIGFF